MTNQTSFSSHGHAVTIVGATGAVGKELLSLLWERHFPIKSLSLLASERSAGKIMSFGPTAIAVEALNEAALRRPGLVFFSAGKERSKAFSALALQAGSTVIDNSSAFRLEEDIPLVVPEINASALSQNAKLIANPNCVAAIVGMALYPIHRLFPIKRAIITTYQSASGAGAAAMEELKAQTEAYLKGENPEPKVLKHPYAFNLFSHDAAIEDNGYNGEENKVILELKKILAAPDLALSASCIRVPILRSHAASINIELHEKPNLLEIEKAFSKAQGIKIVDDRENNHFPMPNEAQLHDDVLVGRLRQDLSHPHALELFVVGDQLRKGAALNAIQIAETLRERKFIP